jgi:hypothetical protein
MKRQKPRRGAMKKFLAGLLVGLFTLLIFGASLNAARTLPQHDLAYAIGNLAGMLLNCLFLFFSVRWYIKLSGHTYKLARQTWAAILFWYSVFAVLCGVAALLGRFIGMGIMFIVLWSAVGFACWKWRQSLRRREAESIKSGVSTATV